MKKIIYIAACVALASVSCVREEVAVVESVVIEAVVSGTDTKTVLTDDVKTYWSKGDEISVFDATKQNITFSTTVTGPCQTAEFLYEGTFSEPSVWWCFYPRNSDIATNDFVTFTGLEIPEMQTAVAGSFDPAAALACASSATAQVKFRNLTSLIKFTVSSDEVSTVKLVSEGGNLAGQATYEGNELTAASDQVILKGSMRKNCTYYIAVAPCEYTALKVYVNGKLVDTKGAKDLEAGAIYNLGEVSNPLKSLVGKYDSQEHTSSFFANDATAGGGYNVFGDTVYLNGDSFTFKNYWNSDVTVPAAQDPHAQTYLVVYRISGLYLYFDIDWENPVNGMADCFPLVNLRDREAGNDQVTHSNSYYDATNDCFNFDFITLGYWAPGGQGGNDLNNPEHLPGDIWHARLAGPAQSI